MTRPGIGVLDLHPSSDGVGSADTLCANFGAGPHVRINNGFALETVAILAVLLPAEVTRRSFGDGIRALTTDRTVPDQESLAGYDAVMTMKPSDMPDFTAHPVAPMEMVMRQKRRAVVVEASGSQHARGTFSPCSPQPSAHDLRSDNRFKAGTPRNAVARLPPADLTGFFLRARKPAPLPHTDLIPPLGSGIRFTRFSDLRADDLLAASISRSAQASGIRRPVPFPFALA
jgi:hypothetical protein